MDARNMFNMMAAFEWETKKPGALFCRTVHIVEVPVGMLGAEIAVAILTRHNIRSTVTTVIANNRICGFIRVRTFGEALTLREIGGITVGGIWVSLDKYKNVRMWPRNQTLTIWGITPHTTDEDIRQHFDRFHPTDYVCYNGRGVIEFVDANSRGAAQALSGTRMNNRIIMLTQR